jgi:hypothetical protein
MSLWRPYTVRNAAGEWDCWRWDCRPSLGTNAESVSNPRFLRKIWVFLTHLWSQTQHLLCFWVIGKVSTELKHVSLRFVDVKPRSVWCEMPFFSFIAIGAGHHRFKTNVIYPSGSRYRMIFNRMDVQTPSKLQFHSTIHIIHTKSTGETPGAIACCDTIINNRFTAIFSIYNLIPYRSRIQQSRCKWYTCISIWCWF